MNAKELMKVAKDAILQSCQNIKSDVVVLGETDLMSKKNELVIGVSSEDGTKVHTFAIVITELK